MTVQGSMIILSIYYTSCFGDKFMFDKNIIPILHKSDEEYQLLNNYVNVINE